MRTDCMCEVSGAWPIADSEDGMCEPHRTDTAYADGSSGCADVIDFFMNVHEDEAHRSEYTARFKQVP